MRRSMVLAVFAFGALLMLTACSAKTTGATKVTDFSATLNATASCNRGESCRWYWEYWRADGRRSPSLRIAVQGPVSGPFSNVNLSTIITGLPANTPFRWVLCGSANSVADYSCVGPNGTPSSTTADPPADSSTFTTGSPTTVAEHWNGASWAVQTTPNPLSQSSHLGGVSCPSATTCDAVGSFTNNSGAQLSLGEAWSGTSWAITPTANPASRSNAALAGVSCTSASACIAVGDAGGLTLAEAWDGTSWTTQSTINPGSQDRFAGVSCTSTTACTAVGSYVCYSPSVGGGLLVERWNGSSWTIQLDPCGPGGFADLNGVSCPSATFCTAVGVSGSGAGVANAALTALWNGTSWTFVTPPNPPDELSPDGDTLLSVSCLSPTACMAVGGYYKTGTTATLAERWDGTSWTIEPTPNPGETPPYSYLGPFLRGVSCTSATSCTAVGTYYSRGAQLPLAEHWNGTTWTVQPIANPQTGDNALSSVSCASDSACTAVGQG